MLDMSEQVRTLISFRFSPRLPHYGTLAGTLSQSPSTELSCGHERFLDYLQPWVDLLFSVYTFSRKIEIKNSYRIL